MKEWALLIFINTFVYTVLFSPLISIIVYAPSWYAVGIAFTVYFGFAGLMLVLDLRDMVRVTNG